MVLNRETVFWIVISVVLVVLLCIFVVRVVSSAEHKGESEASNASAKRLQRASELMRLLASAYIDMQSDAHLPMAPSFAPVELENGADMAFRVAKFTVEVYLTAGTMRIIPLGVDDLDDNPESLELSLTETDDVTPEYFRVRGFLETHLVVR